jgi:hypothetical protein
MVMSDDLEWIKQATDAVERRVFENVARCFTLAKVSARHT